MTATPAHIIIAYTKTGCGWCRGVMDLLKEHNLPFEERNVMENPVFFEELIKKSGQARSPTLDIDGEIIANTDADAVEKYLKDKHII